jgi:glycosyltransferase involved in cell wall biosynthesis
MRICMLLHKDVEHDSRVRREATALAAAGHRVTLVHLPPGDGDPGLQGVECVSATCPPALRRWLPWRSHRLVEVARMIREVLRARADAVHCHDVAMLVPGYFAARARGSRLVYDSHELATGVPYHSRAWGLLVATIERLLVPRCDAVITVSEGIADRLQVRYALPTRPAVVRNVPDLPADGEARDLRKELGIGDAPLILHQGAVARSRGCETLIRAIDGLDQAHLVFLGAEGGYVRGLEDLARSEGVSARVHFVPPVPLERLLSHTRQADTGVSLLEANCENHRLALPNKAFEYLSAGLPVLVTEDSELSGLIADLDVGESADPSSPADVRDHLRSVLSRRGDTPFHHRIKIAGQRLSWSLEKARLIEVYENL